MPCREAAGERLGFVSLSRDADPVGPYRRQRGMLAEDFTGKRPFFLPHSCDRHRNEGAKKPACPFRLGRLTDDRRIRRNPVKDAVLMSHGIEFCSCLKTPRNVSFPGLGNADAGLLPHSRASAVRRVCRRCRRACGSSGRVRRVRAAAGRDLQTGACHAEGR